MLATHVRSNRSIPPSTVVPVLTYPDVRSVLVRVDDARAHCESAREHGATILMEPTDFEYGERQYAAQDPAGHHWTFPETLADVAPEEWGGTTVSAR